jgi:hypothetical protein
MILQVSPDAPAIVRVAAASLLYLHIGGAAVGLVSGAAAMVARKGGRLHRWAGNVFFVGMLTMAGVGGAVAPFLPAEQVPNTIAGVFTFYLVATAWATVRRKPGETGRFEIGAFLAILSVAVAGFSLAWLNAHSAHPYQGPQAYALLVFAGVGTIAAVSDLNMILRGGLSGASRLARHLWRMSVALLVAAGSFAGQPKAIPDFLKGSPLLFLPMLAVLIAMIYYLIRVQFPRRAKAPATTNGQPRAQPPGATIPTRRSLAT